jgi:hypothetical protein
MAGLTALRRWTLIAVLAVGCGGSPKSGTGGGGAGGTTGSAGTTGAGGEAGAGGTGPDGAMSLPMDAMSELPPPPQCLGAAQACDGDAGTCCEAYVCRLGKCCTPNGIRTNCIANSDCCSGTCVLNQCTCTPKGYSCKDSSQCCSGFSCENGTCICPPDIRGCT